jgi:hypothetical protein
MCLPYNAQKTTECAVRTPHVTRQGRKETAGAVATLKDTWITISSALLFSCDLIVNRHINYKWKEAKPRLLATLMNRLG